MKPFDYITKFIFLEDQPQKADIILVPGGMRPQLIERAIELFQQGFAPYILPSGGVGPKLAKEGRKTPWSSEWEYLRSLALAKDVPEQAILKEDRAKNTFQNAKFSWQVLQEKNVGVKKAILVCKAHHALRALLTYQTEFPLDVKFFVCPIIDDRDIKFDNWFLDEKKTALVMSEIEKIGQYFGQHIPKWVK